jgi:predicted helicase
MGDWITRLIEDYKYVDGEHFGERKHWLHDDYVKFLRLAEETISRNPSGGVLGFITNHGYLDNPTFRGMRWHLLNTFDSIHVLDLHGNANKRETTPSGEPDANVFDIQQGVAIIIAVKRSDGRSQPLAEVSHQEF